MPNVSLSVVVESDSHNQIQTVKRDLPLRAVVTAGIDERV
jgi:hypothetical protein